MATSNEPETGPLLPLRTALIVLIALVIGGMIGGLTFWAVQSLPHALLVGLTGAAAALLPLDKIIGR